MPQSTPPPVVAPPPKLHTRTHCPNCQTQYAPHARVCHLCGRTRDRISDQEIAANRQAEQGVINQGVAQMAAKRKAVDVANLKLLTYVIAGAISLCIIFAVPALALLIVAGLTVYAVLAPPEKRKAIPIWAWGAGVASVLCAVGAVVSKPHPIKATYPAQSAPATLPGQQRPSEINVAPTLSHPLVIEKIPDDTPIPAAATNYTPSDEEQLSEIESLRGESHTDPVYRNR